MPFDCTGMGCDAHTEGKLAELNGVKYIEPTPDQVGWIFDALKAWCPKCAKKTSEQGGMIGNSGAETRMRALNQEAQVKAVSVHTGDLPPVDPKTGTRSGGPPLNLDEGIHPLPTFDKGRVVAVHVSDGDHWQCPRCLGVFKKTETLHMCREGEPEITYVCKLDGGQLVWLNQETGKFDVAGGRCEAMPHPPMARTSKQSFEDLRSMYPHDPVNHPSHHTFGGIETIDFIEAKQLGFHDGNVVKYVARARHKGDEVQDLEKAEWYLKRLIEKRKRELAGG